MEGMDYLRFLVALVFVLGLIGVLAAVARRAGWGFPTTTIKPGRKRRLSVVEAAPIDARRRMVLIRRDDVEHLVLISPTSEMLIETDIGSHQSVSNKDTNIETHQDPKP